MIEQPAELKIAHPNAVRWEAVDAIPGQVAVTPSQLLAAALRHRPDRIIMGEIRDECGYDLLQAMNTGHGGTLSTIHAKSAWDALNRLSDLALSARPNLNHAFMRSETAEAIDFVLYCERDHAGRRRVRELIHGQRLHPRGPVLRDRGNLSRIPLRRRHELRNGNPNRRRGDESASRSLCGEQLLHAQGARLSMAAAEQKTSEIGREMPLFARRPGGKSGSGLPVG